MVTQNIDGLHQKAGSQKVLELHGSVLRNYCTRCGKFHSAEFVKDAPGVPRCGCGGIVKPDVVLYEESLRDDVIEQSVAAIAKADLLIVAGTSLTVYPAAGLLRYYRGNRMVKLHKFTRTGPFKSAFMFWLFVCLILFTRFYTAPFTDVSK